MQEPRSLHENYIPVIMAVICVLAAVTLWLFRDTIKRHSIVINQNRGSLINAYIPPSPLTPPSPSSNVAPPAELNLNVTIYNANVPVIPTPPPTTYPAYPSITVSGVQFTTLGDTATVVWTTNVPSGGIFYYGLSYTTEHTLQVDGYNTLVHSVSFPVVPGETYKYVIDPCVLGANGNSTCTPQPSGIFVAK